MGSPLAPNTAELMAKLGQNRVKVPDTDKAGRSVEQAQKAAREFEAVFISQMVNEMYGDIDMGRFSGGFGEKVWKDHLVQEYGKAISQTNSIGVSDQIMREMLQQKDQNGHIIDNPDLDQYRSTPVAANRFDSINPLNDKLAQKTSAISQQPPRPVAADPYPMPLSQPLPSAVATWPETSREISPALQSTEISGSDKVQNGHQAALSAYMIHNDISAPNQSGHQSALSAYQMAAKQHDQALLKAKYALSGAAPQTNPQKADSLAPLPDKNIKTASNTARLPAGYKSTGSSASKLPDLTDAGKKILKSLDGQMPTAQQQRELALLEQELAALKLQK